MPSFYKKSIVLFDKNLAECRFSIIVEVERVCLPV